MLRQRRSSAGGPGQGFWPGPLVCAAMHPVPHRTAFVRHARFRTGAVPASPCDVDSAWRSWAGRDEGFGADGLGEIAIRELCRQCLAEVVFEAYTGVFVAELGWC